MGVDHGRLDAPVAEELLDRPDVIAIEQKVGRKAVPKRMAGGVLGDPGLSCRIVEDSLYASLVHVMAPLLACCFLTRWRCSSRSGLRESGSMVIRRFRNTTQEPWPERSRELGSVDLNASSRGLSGRGWVSPSCPGHRPTASALGCILPARWAGLRGASSSRCAIQVPDGPSKSPTPHLDPRRPV
jgi:hypothetical protein